MPELPEVQTVVNSLKSNIINKKIVSFNKFWDKVIYTNNFSYLSKTINSKTIHNIDRIGKYIIIFLSKGYIVFHLRMTGYLYYSKTLKINKHTQCYFTFSDDSFLIYDDIRKFGGFYYLKLLTSITNKIGLDPYNQAFTSAWLFDNIKQKNRQIKSLLLDQSFICGLGNIYIDEILWKSQIHPLKKTSLLNKRDINNMHNNILFILNESIEYHGTTFINFKFDNMKTGNYKSKLNVFDRESKLCSRCNTTIMKIRVSGRGTYLCSSCQKL